MTELTAAPTLIAQTGIDALLSQLMEGRLTPDEYRAALAFVSPPVEEGPRCIYCASSALVGTTCAAHADRTAIAAAARATRAVVNLARFSTRHSLTAAVIATLEREGLTQSARHFSERAAGAHGMNAVCQIARDYVRLETRIV